MRRNEKDLPGHLVDAPGNAIEHNPGATLIWVTKNFKPIRAPGGVLFEIGEPLEMYWYKEGRTATRAEVIASIDKGLPFLREEAAKEGSGAQQELDRYIDRAMKLLPAA
jgi:hypothetical protein